MEHKLTAYKGFDKDLKCRGFQYEIGKEYEHQGEVKVCESGFHACENPFDVLDYYGDVLENRFCEVEQSGETERNHDKTVSSRIKIKAEIGFAGLFKAGIEWLKEITDPQKIKATGSRLNDNGGNFAQIGSSGNDAQIGSSGNFAQIGSSGDGARIGSSGNGAQIGSSGNGARIGSSGNGAQIGSSGNGAQIGSSGYFAQIGSSGYDAKIGSSGNFARIGSSGYDAKIGSSGNGAQIGSSGNFAQIGSSGDGAQIDSTGEDSVICCAGHNSCAKAKVGSWITLAEWIYSDAKGHWTPKCVKTEYVDGERIKADTWYRLNDGVFVEINK